MATAGRPTPARSRRAGRVAIASLTTVALLGAYLLGVKHAHLPVASVLLRLPVVRRYLLDPDLDRVATFLAARDEADGLFATVWDTNSGVLLSRRLYSAVEMFGVPRYRYKANLRKLAFVAGTETRREFETEDTPEIRALIAPLHGRAVASSYDRSGFRRGDPELAQDCDAHVLFLGDSFTDGAWVADAETFVNGYGHVARSRSDIAVCPVNAGVDGYGSLEEAYVLEHLFEAAGSPRLVILMYFPNDVDEDYDAVLNGTLADADRKWTESESYLRRAGAFARSQDATLVIAAIPPVEQLSHPSSRAHYQDRLEAFCRREGLAFLDLMPDLQRLGRRDLYWDWDPHFTPAGHEAVANILYERTQTLVAALPRAARPR